MYDEMFQFVKDYLVKNDGEATKLGYFPYRVRSEHIKRVFMWAERLIEGQNNINKAAVLTAAVFHDIGYASPTKNKDNHGEIGAVICEKYLRDKGYEEDFIKFVTYLVRNHSEKDLMSEKDTPLELIILMEADLLDETGALSVIWDCMVEGAKQVQTFEKTYKHIMNYTYRDLSTNPMVTSKARAYWEDKRRLTRDFVEQLAFDLGLE